MRCNESTGGLARFHGKTLVVLIASLIVGACGDTAVTQSPINSDSQTPISPDFVFVGHPLPGVHGAAAFAYPTPPYAVSTANDGSGHLTVLDLTTIGLGDMYSPPRVPYDVRTADFDGDGMPDVISTVYSPTTGSSWAYLYSGSAQGIYSRDLSFETQYATANGSGFRGRTETVVVADFSNTGAVDIFLPTYTYLDSIHDLSGDPADFVRPGPPPNVNNALQSFLLLNDGTGKFTEAAVAAGVSMHSRLSGILPDSTDPEGTQPEGAQAVDFNMDGLIDLYVAGHLFINQGVDAQGVPHFKDMAAAWGLTQAVLRAPPPWAPDVNHTIPSNNLVTDEGAKFLDWNNDGRLDLLLFRWDWGSAHGARLFEFTGTQFIERQYALTTPSETCKQPAVGQVPFFSSPRAPSGNNSAAGINAYDLDNGGLEDVLVTGDTTGSAVFRNDGCGFKEVSAGDLSGPGSSGGMALADIDGDGVIDVVYPASDGVAYYLNKTPLRGVSFTIEVVGPNGEHNQYGRVIQVFPPNSTQIYTRVVDGGSGYLTQNQYPILVGTPFRRVGTPFRGLHRVKVYFAPLTKCVYGGPPCQAAVLTFFVYPGQRAIAYAPSPSFPFGKAVITTRAPSPPSR